MTGDKSGKPVSSKAPDGLILDAFSTSDDFEERLSQVAGRPAMPGPRTEDVPLVFEAPFLEAAGNEVETFFPATETAPAQAETRSAQIGIDPEHAQYQFYVKRLHEKEQAYPADDEENALKQSANVMLYILEEFDYPIDDDKRLKIIRRMRRILGLSRIENLAARPREPFLGARLRDKVDALYKRHMRRYALHRMEVKKQQALEEAARQRAAEAAHHAEAEKKRQEKEKKRAQQTISEEKLRQLEEEFDAMMALTASNYGISAAKLMTFGYEEPEDDAHETPQLPATKKEGAPRRTVRAVSNDISRGRLSGNSRMPKTPKSANPSGARVAGSGKEGKGLLTPEEIMRRNMERRRQRGLLDEKNEK